MLKLIPKIWEFSKRAFYRPCEFKVEVEELRELMCPLGMYIDCYRKYGHHYAKLDPLSLPT
jgi:2-oxoglutarate dehydrogenase complex dehydrogenase (E1) component-like enzyme